MFPALLCVHRLRLDRRMATVLQCRVLFDMRRVRQWCVFSAVSRMKRVSRHAVTDDALSLAFSHRPCLLTTVVSMCHYSPLQSKASSSSDACDRHVPILNKIIYPFKLLVVGMHEM